MTHILLSSGFSPYVFTMLRVDVTRLACVSGTRLGRLVVPLVWRTSATSSGFGLSGEEEEVPLDEILEEGETEKEENQG